MKAFPFKYYSYEKANRIVTSVFYRKGDLVTFFGRMLPPLNLSQTEAQEMVAGMEKTFTSSPWLFLWVGVKQHLHTRYLTARGRLTQLLHSSRS